MNQPNTIPSPKKDVAFGLRQHACVVIRIRFKDGGRCTHVQS
jgi:hypothetical protein